MPTRSNTPQGRLTRTRRRLAGAFVIAALLFGACSSSGSTDVVSSSVPAVDGSASGAVGDTVADGDAVAATTPRSDTPLGGLGRFDEVTSTFWLPQARTVADGASVRRIDLHGSERTLAAVSALAPGAEPSDASRFVAVDTAPGGTVVAQRLDADGDSSIVLVDGMNTVEVAAGRSPVLDATGEWIIAIDPVIEHRLLLLTLDGRELDRLDLDAPVVDVAADDTRWQIAALTVEGRSTAVVQIDVVGAELAVARSISVPAGTVAIAVVDGALATATVVDGATTVQLTDGAGIVLHGAVVGGVAVDLDWSSNGEVGVVAIDAAGTFWVAGSSSGLLSDRSVTAVRW